MPDTKTGFHVTKWKAANGVAHDNYECDSCQFATLDLSKMREHQFHDDHKWTFPPDANKEGGNQ